MPHDSNHCILSAMKPKQDMPSLELLRTLIAYDCETGNLTWIGPEYGSGNVRRLCGKKQGTPHHSGYLYVRLGERYFGKRSILAHRMAWALHYGEWPRDDIDHVNGDKSDNRIANLRAATRRQNKYNSKRRRDNTTGFKGVGRASKANRSKPFCAQIMVKGKRYNLGFYATAEEAHEAYGLAARKLHGEFARVA